MIIPEKAHVLLAQQDYELAARFLTRILTADPAQIEARELIGLCLLELGQVGEAREVCGLHSFTVDSQDHAR